MSEGGPPPAPPDPPPASAPRRQRLRRRLRLLSLGLFLPALAEIGSYAAGRALQRRWGMYVDPVKVSPQRKTRDYADYLAVRDPELGWPYPREIGGPDFGPDGAVRLPCDETLAAAPVRVALYGESYTWALTNTPPAQSWPQLLAERLGARVKNWAVPGYGTDQAYLRFLRNADDRAPVAIFGHMAEDVARNLTRLRDLGSGGGLQGFAFKPRFQLDAQGRLELLPLLALSHDEYLRFLALREPQLILPGESFHPNGPLGAVRLTFPFTLALLRNTGFYRLRARLGGYPDYLPLYAPDHPLGGLALTRALLRAFAEEARRRGQRPLVILFPGPDDTRWAQETGGRAMRELEAGLRADGVEVHDFTDALLAWLNGRPIDAAYAKSHFVAALDPVIAAWVAERIQAPPR